MWYLLTRRVVRHGTGSTGAYQPRSANRESWHISGPWSKRPLAERAAVAALGQHTCLSAEVYSAEEMARLAAASPSYEGPQDAARLALGRHEQ